MKRKVAVTGIGALTPLGIGIKENWEKIKNGEQAISQIEFPGGNFFPHTLCGVVNNFNPFDFISERKIIKLMNIEAQMVVSATKLAIEDASIDGYYSPCRTGLYMGTGLTSGGLEDLIPLAENSIDESCGFSYHRLGLEALPNCNPLISFKMLTNMPLCYISILFKIKGPNLVFNPWSSKTAQAIGEGMRAIQHGEIDCAVVGGCDSKSHYIGFLTFSKLEMLSKKGISRPFDKERDGIILSEGACMLILEELEKAESRRAKIYAVLAGYAVATDTASENLFSKNPIVLENAMKKAISDSDLNPDDVDFICASANSHPIGDFVEAQAIEGLFSKKSPRVNSVKALTGDMIAAAAPFELAVCALSLKEGLLPAMANLENIDEDIQLQLCKNEPEKKDVKAALSNSFEMGNSKVSLVLRRHS